MKSLITALALTLYAGAALAAGPAFEEADANADGVITLEEAKVALPETEEAALVAADTNADGVLTQPEYEVLVAD